MDIEFRMFAFFGTQHFEQDNSEKLVYQNSGHTRPAENY